MKSEVRREVQLSEKNLQEISLLVDGCLMEMPNRQRLLERGFEGFGRKITELTSEYPDLLGIPADIRTGTEMLRYLSDPANKVEHELLYFLTDADAMNSRSLLRRRSKNSVDRCYFNGLHREKMTRELVMCMSAGVVFAFPLFDLIEEGPKAQQTCSDLRWAAAYSQGIFLQGTHDPLIELLLINQRKESSEVLYEALIAAKRTRDAIEQHFTAGGTVIQLPREALYGIRQLVEMSPELALQENHLTPKHYTYPNLFPAPEYQTRALRSHNSDEHTSDSYFVARQMISQPIQKWRHHTDAIVEALGIEPKLENTNQMFINGEIILLAEWDVRSTTEFCGMYMERDWSSVRNTIGIQSTPTLNQLAVMADLVYRIPTQRRGGAVENVVREKGDLHQYIIDRQHFPTWFLFRKIRDYFDWGIDGAIMEEMKTKAEHCETTINNALRAVDPKGRWIHTFVHEFATSRAPDYLRAFKEYLNSGEDTELLIEERVIPALASVTRLDQSDRKILTESAIFTAQLDELIELADQFYGANPLVTLQRWFQQRNYKSRFGIDLSGLDAPKCPLSRKLEVISQISAIARVPQLDRREAENMLTIFTLAEAYGRRLVQEWRGGVIGSDILTEEELADHCNSLTHIFRFAIAVGDLPTEAQACLPLQPDTLNERVADIRSIAVKANAQMCDEVVPVLLAYARAVTKSDDEMVNREFVLNEIIVNWFKKSVLYDLDDRDTLMNLLNAASKIPVVAAKRVVRWITRGTGATLQTADGIDVRLPKCAPGLRAKDFPILVGGEEVEEPLVKLRVLFPQIPVAALNYAQE